MSVTASQGTADARLVELVQRRAALSHAKSQAPRTNRLPFAGAFAAAGVVMAAFMGGGVTGWMRPFAVGCVVAAFSFGRRAGVAVRERLRARHRRSVVLVTKAIAITVLQAHSTLSPSSSLSARSFGPDPVTADVSPQAAVFAVVTLSQIPPGEGRGPLKALSALIPSPIAQALALCAEDVDDVTGWGFTFESFRAALVRAQSPHGLVVFDALEMAWPIMASPDPDRGAQFDRKAGQLHEVLAMLDVLDACPGAFDVFATLVDDRPPASMTKLRSYLDAAVTISTPSTA